MAANGSSFIRVRLFFDYPPPSVVDCRMCWLLVDLNSCRVVSDLESLIRDKFDFSPRSIFNLFIDDCYLPHTESIFLVRDNDSVWVKVDSAAQVNGHSSRADTSSKNCRKRNRPTEEDGAGAEEGSVERKSKKKRKKNKECPSVETDRVSGSKKSKKKSRDKHAEKEKKKQKVEKNDSAVTSKPAATTTKKPTAGGGGKTLSKTSSSESSEEDEAPSKNVISKPTPKTQLSAIKTTTGNDTKQKTTPGKKSAVPSESSSSSSEEDEAPRTQTASKPNSKKQPCTPAAVKPPTGDKPTQKKTQSKKSSSDSSSSEDGEVSKKSPASKLVSKTSLPTPAAPKTTTGGRPAQSKPRPSSSSSSDTSSDEATSVRAPPRGKPFTALSPQRKSHDNIKTQSTNDTQEQPSTEATPPLGDGVAATRDSDGEEEIELVIRKPNPQLWKGVGGQPSWRGGNSRRAGGGGRSSRGDRGRGGGRGDARGRAGRFGPSCNGAMEPSYQTDLLTNESVVIQNGAVVEAAPKKDYSTLPLLAAPPQVGQRIAFKLLELTENYTPEVSEYKEGKIVSFDPATRQMELELLNESHPPVEPGKFDLVYQNPDGSERVEYAVARGAWVTERWESLLEPRLVI